MPGPSLTGVFLSRLNKAGIPYIITGATNAIYFINASNAINPMNSINVFDPTTRFCELLTR